MKLELNKFELYYKIRVKYRVYLQCVKYNLNVPVHYCLMKLQHTMKTNHFYRHMV